MKRAAVVCMTLLACWTSLAIGSRSSAAESVAGVQPELPRLSVDTKIVPPSGRTLSVRAGGNFQKALDAAQPGDTIRLEAGAVFKGPFTLPRKEGSGWIVVRTGAPDDRLPPSGMRVDPSYAKAMPTLEARRGSVIRAALGAHHYRFIGIEIRPRKNVFLYNLVLLGEAETSPEEVPHHIVFDRCYLHGDPKKGTRRGIAMNSAHTAVVDSHLSDFKEIGADSQAIAGWNGPGPFKIVNNYIEGAGENVIFGGAPPTIDRLIPSDIEIRHNHFSKPLSWKMGEPNYGGKPWAVKNLFELKNARRVLIEENLFEHNWVHAQNGFAILFTVRGDDGRVPWAAVEEVTFTSNVVRHTAGGINILGRDDNGPSGQSRRILIKNNLFEDVGADRWGGGGRLFQLLNGTAEVVIDHNTALQTGNILTVDGPPHTGFVYVNNLTPHNEYGIFGGGVGVGNPAIQKYLPGAVIRKNVMAGGNPAQYPPNNFFPSSLSGAGFINLAGGDYRLADSSPYRRAGTDDQDVGADFDRLRRGKR